MCIKQSLQRGKNVTLSFLVKSPRGQGGEYSSGGYGGTHEASRMTPRSAPGSAFDHISDI